jgi:hypothetical protein
MSNPEHLKQIKSVADAYAQIKNAEHQATLEQEQQPAPVASPVEEKQLDEDADVGIGGASASRGASAFKKVQKGFPNRAIAGRALDKARKVEDKEVVEKAPKIKKGLRDKKGRIHTVDMSIDGDKLSFRVADEFGSFKTVNAKGLAKMFEAAEGDFEPHMMYDPKTGKGYKANTMADHLKFKDMGYTHEKPEAEEKKKGNVTINPELSEDGHTDVSSAIRKCKTIMEDAQDILTALDTMGPEEGLPTWWMNAVTISAHELNSMRDYIKNPTAEEKE